MTDRELLELAAKAAGHKIYKNESNRDGILIFKEGRQQFLEEDGSPISLWNPLTDDGDALRLAVKLGIEIHFDREIAEVITAFCVRRPGLVGLNTFEEFGSDEMYATRRAITRAAAEIGRSMK